MSASMIQKRWKGQFCPPLLGCWPQGSGNVVAGWIASTLGIHVQGNDTEGLPIPVGQGGQKAGIQGRRVEFDEDVIVPLFIHWGYSSD